MAAVERQLTVQCVPRRARKARTALARTAGGARGARPPKTHLVAPLLAPSEQAACARGGGWPLVSTAPPFASGPRASPARAAAMGRQGSMVEKTSKFFALQLRLFSALQLVAGAGYIGFACALQFPPGDPLTL